MATGCRARNQAGAPCSAAVWQDHLCRWHHPGLEAERREWSRRGGRGKSNRARARRSLGDEAMTLGEVKGVLCRALRRVEAGQLEPGPANALASLARAITQVTEVSEIEERVAELEHQAGLGGKTA